MGLPGKTFVGEQLESRWLNELRQEVKSNTITAANGLTFRRTKNGLILNAPNGGSRSFTGEIVTVVNNTVYDLKQFWFVGIDNVTSRDNMVDNVSDTIDYLARKPKGKDLFGNLLMLAEPIDSGAAGDAYIRSSSMITRIAYATDGTEDDYRYATIDTTANEGNEDAYLLKAAGAGPISVIDVEAIDNSHASWRWAVIKFPGLLSAPLLWQATADEANFEITAKQVNLDDTLDDLEVTFKTIGYTP